MILHVLHVPATELETDSFEAIATLHHSLHVRRLAVQVPGTLRNSEPDVDDTHARIHTQVWITYHKLSDTGRREGPLAQPYYLHIGNFKSFSSSWPGRAGYLAVLRSVDRRPRDVVHDVVHDVSMASAMRSGGQDRGRGGPERRNKVIPAMTLRLAGAEKARFEAPVWSDL